MEDGTCTGAGRGAAGVNAPEGSCGGVVGREHGAARRRRLPRTVRTLLLSTLGGVDGGAPELQPAMLSTGEGLLFCCWRGSSRGLERTKLIRGQLQEELN